MKARFVLRVLVLIGLGLAVGGCVEEDVAARAGGAASLQAVEPPPPGASLAAWMALYGGLEGEEMEGLLVTETGEMLVSGSTASYRDENGDAWILKLDPNGNVLWQKTYGGEGDEYAIDIQAAPDGGYIVAGWTESFGAGQTDIWVFKLDPDGNIQWEKTYGGRKAEQAWAVDVTRDGGYIVAGGTTSFGAGGADYWVLKLDPEGDVLWQKTYGGGDDDGGGGEYEEFVVRVLEDRDGNYVLASETASFGAGETDIWVLKLDSQGEILWQKAYGGEYEDSIWSFQEAADGGYLLPGVTTSFSPDLSGDLWVLKIDPAGEILWQRVYGVPDLWDEALSVGASADGGALIGGYYEEADDWDLTLLRLDASGEALWQRRYEYGWDWPNAVQTLPDGGFAVAGVAWPNDQELPEDLWMMRLSGEGTAGDTCNPVQELDLSLADTHARVITTTAVVTETDVTPMESHAIVEDTPAEPRYLCWQAADSNP